MKKLLLMLLLPAMIILGLLLAIFGDDESAKETASASSTTVAESQQSSFSLEEVLSGYDLACSKSNLHNIIYYKLFDFDSGLETEFSLVYKRHSTELDKIEVSGSCEITPKKDNTWKEIYRISDESIVELVYEIKDIDGVDKIIKYDYKGDESDRYLIVDLDKTVDYLKEGLKKHDAWNVERLLTPQSN